MRSAWPSERVWVLLAAAALAGCATRGYRPPPGCLEGRPTGRHVADEASAALRTELARSDSMSPILRAAVIQRSWVWPRLFDEDLPYDWQCTKDLGARLTEQTFGTAPLPYTRLLLARLEVAGWVLDEHLLVRVAKLPESALTEYQPAPGEAPPSPPPRSLVRLLAMSHMNANYPEVVEFMRARALSPADDREELLVLGYQAGPVEAAAAAHAPAELKATARMIVERWLADTRRRLPGPPDSLSAELVIRHVEGLTRYARQVGLRDDADALFSSIEAAGGDFPVTRGVPGAARDLTVAAKLGLGGGAGILVGEATAVPRERTIARPLDPWLAWLERRPSQAGELPADEQASRAAQLEHDWRGARYSGAKCVWLGELVRYADARKAVPLLEELIAPIAAEPLAFSRERRCRIGAIAALTDSDRPRRAHALAALLRSTSTVRLGEALEVQTAALSLLGRDPGVVDDDGELRVVLPLLLPAHIESPTSQAAQFELAVHPLLARVVAFHASSAPGADPELGRRIITAWCARIRDDLSRAIWNGYVYDLTEQRAYAVATFAPRLGASAEAKGLLEHMATLDETLHHRQWSADAAKRALALLEQGPAQRY